MRAFEEAAARIAEKAGVPFEDALRAIGVPRERDRADLALPCFPFAKKMGKAPPAIAAEIAAAFEPGLLSSAEATGPFVNFRVDRARFAEAVLAGAELEDLGERKTVVVDYGSPNIAKPLLFHHLRSAVIGQALVNIHRACGYEVVGLNYLGDVGTAFGKLMVGIEEFGEPETIEAFKKTYVDASKGCSENPEWMDRARAWAKKLEDGDAAAQGHWETARNMSLDAFAQVYDRLGVHHDVVDGEKMYVERAHDLVEELLQSGKAVESEGGVVIETGAEGAVPHPQERRRNDCIQHARHRRRRSTGSSATDSRSMLYLTDVAQQLHFKQLFKSLEKLGYAVGGLAVEHIAFGQVLVDGSRTKTREGEAVELIDVLNEGERRARVIVEEKNPDLPDKDATARAVGTAAVIFCDVGFPVAKNINFDWDAILSFDGRTGPYLQYVHASACSILGKGGGVPDEADATLLSHESEWALLRRLAEYPDAVARACRECEPSHVSNFLYELARDFRSYHAAGGREPSLRVLTDDEAAKAARLRLVGAVRDALAGGLRMLGIEPLERM